MSWLCTCAALQSAKLKQSQEQNQVLTREKEALVLTIQDLKARIKQGAQGRWQLLLGYADHIHGLR